MLQSCSSLTNACDTVVTKKLAMKAMKEALAAGKTDAAAKAMGKD